MNERHDFLTPKPFPRPKFDEDEDPANQTVGPHTNFPEEDEYGERSKPDTSPSQTKVPKPEPARRKPVLITLDGRRVSERFVLDRETSVLGRDIAADILIVDGEVSRKHAQITWTNMNEIGTSPICILSDLGSTNGTFLNNERVRDQKMLVDGDQFRLGKTTLGFFVKDERVLELDQLLMSMALHDALTGLFKREFLFSELHREFDRSRRHGRPLSVLMLDLDHFKSVNDELGHLAGDEALRQFSHLLRLSVREGDICGRYGGEEFIILLPETDKDGAELAAERIRRTVEKHLFELGKGQTRHITTSIGCAVIHPDHRDKTDLLESADEALYAAKHAGRNRIAFAEPPKAISVDETIR